MALNSRRAGRKSKSLQADKREARQNPPDIKIPSLPVGTAEKEKQERKTNFDYTNHSFNYSTPSSSFIKPWNIQEEHWKELTIDSCIDPGIAKLNWLSSGDPEPGEYPDIFSYLNVYEGNVLASGKLSDPAIKRFENFWWGGWWVAGVSLTLENSIFKTEDMKWGQFKPNKPREVEKDGKTKKLKYESPYKTPARLILLKPSPRAWEEAVKNFQPKIQLTYVPFDYRIDPARYWIWVAQNALPIIICEGAKKAAALMSQGYPAIALPGITMAYRKDDEAWKINLIPEFEPLLHTKRCWYFCFDAETKPTTIRNVNTAISRTAGLLLDRKHKVKIITLPIPTEYGDKCGVDDFIAGGGDFKALFDSAKSLIEWKAAWTEVLTLDPERSRELTLEDLEKVNGKLYLPSDLIEKVPENEQFIAIKAPMGQGKTNSIKSYVRNCMISGIKILVPGHRVQLGQALANVLGIAYLSEIAIKEIKEGSPFYGLGLCVDSMHRRSKAQFRVDEWQGVTVVLDEVEQMIQHLLFSTTSVKENRSEIIQNLGDVLVGAIKAGMKIVISDAHLTDISINFIKGLVKEYGDLDISPYIILSEQKTGETRQCYYFNQGKPIALYEKLLEHIDEHGKAFICSDGQKEESTFGTQALGKILKEKYPELRILIIDSDTTKDQNHPAFGIADNINAEIENWDIVISSPSLGTGVSIDVRGYFKGVFGFFNGVVTPKQVLQQVSRVRDDVPRYIWAATRGLTFIAGGYTSLQAIRLHEEYRFGQAIASIKASARFSSDEFSEKNIGGSLAALDCYEQMALRINSGSQEFRNFVRRSFLEDGYDLIEIDDDLDGDKKKVLQDEVQKNRDELSLADSTKKAEAEGVDKYVEVTEVEAVVDAGTGFKIAKVSRDKVKQLRDNGEIDKYQYSKLFLSANYKVPLEEVTPEMVAADKDGMYAALRLSYWIGTGASFIKNKDIDVLDKYLKFGNGFKPDIAKDTVGWKSALVEQTGLLKFISKKVLRNDDPELIEFIETLKLYSQISVKATTGVSLREEDTPIEAIKKLLLPYGYKLGRGKKLGRDGARVQLYEVYDKFAPWREITEKRWLELDKQSSKENANKRIDLRQGKRVDIEDLDLDFEAGRLVA